MWKKTLTMLVSTLLSFVTSQALQLPIHLFSQVSPGKYYLYNVKQEQFLVRLSSNFPGLSTSPTEITVTQAGSNNYTLQFADGCYLKTDYWNNQYLWTDGTAGKDENLWVFIPITETSNVYQLCRAAKETLNNETGTFYANGTNAATSPTDDCQWALVATSDYDDLALANAIPIKYRSALPTEEGEYYLYDALTQQFLNTTNRSLSAEPEATTTITPVGSSFLISGEKDKYLKIGVYKGQYLWSDGDTQNTKWMIEAEKDKEDNKLYYIYTNNFTETNNEVAGKTMYMIGTNASANKPSRARWILLTEAAYVEYLSSGEGIVDTKAAAEAKTIMIEAKGDATSLIQNPNFERSDDGWWGGKRTICQLYRGNGYAYESDADGEVILQTIKNMPKGTYKVVAAVRGTKGTSVTARVADNAGEIVANHGSNYVGSQININGVMMPYSTLGGFSVSENAQGWTWLTAMGSLNDDGHLKIEFQQSGNGTVDVTDVHLYYMNDETRQYAVDYIEGVDAVNHAVVCHLTTDNPNHLFTSTAAITTASNTKLNNNLVSGTVSNLIVWDGYDFKAASDFIATKATYYCNITAGTVTTLCLPFAVTLQTDGTFYQPLKLNGKTLNMKQVNKPEAGNAYLYCANNDINILTGSGTVKAMPVTSTMMTGSFTKKNVLPQDCYVINGNSLTHVNNNSTLDAFRAYFTIESDANKLTMSFDATDEDDIWRKPQVKVSDYVTNKECYLYNVDAKRFYTEGNAYGTQASVGETGLKVKFIESNNAVKLTNYSDAKKAWRTTFVTTNGAMFVDGETPTECYWQVVPTSEKTFRLMISTPNASYNQANYPGAMMGLDLFEDNLRTNLAALLFSDEEPGEDLYLTDWTVVSTSDYDAYQLALTTYKAALNLKELLNEAITNEIDVSDEMTVYENTQSTLEQLTNAITSVTTKLIEGDLSSASWESPLDLTDKFIINARYENNNNEGWTGSAPGIDATNNLQNAEFFNTNFDTYQDLVGLPDGYYRLRLQGFYRAGLEAPALEAKQNGTEDQVMNAVLYATTDGKTITTKMQSIFTDAPQTALGINGEIHNGDWWVPNTMASAAAYFAAGYYQQNAIIVHVTNGKLRIGLRKNTTIRRDWVMIDNWKLEYMGKTEK